MHNVSYNKILIALMATIIGFSSLALPSSSWADYAGNLLPNGELELTNGKQTAATGWTANKWGTITTSFSYDASGTNHFNTIAVTKRTSGDAKWTTAPVTVAANQTYTFTSTYKSNVVTEIDAAITFANGTVQYKWLMDVPASAAAWRTVQTSFKTPADATEVQMYHLIAKVGSLSTDNQALVAGSSLPTPTVAPTATPTPTPAPTATATPRPNC